MHFVVRLCSWHVALAATRSSDGVDSLTSYSDEQEEQEESPVPAWRRQSPRRAGGPPQQQSGSPPRAAAGSEPTGKRSLRTPSLVVDSRLAEQKEEEVFARMVGDSSDARLISERSMCLQDRFRVERKGEILEAELAKRPRLAGFVVQSSTAASTAASSSKGPAAAEEVACPWHSPGKHATQLSPRGEGKKKEEEEE